MIEQNKILKNLLHEGLNLCVRASKLDDPIIKHEFFQCHSATPHLWVIDQYDNDLKEWMEKVKLQLGSSL